MVTIHLSKTERNELTQLRKQVSSKDSEKALMVLLCGDAISPVEIGKQLKRHPHTIIDWLKRYNESRS